MCVTITLLRFNKQSQFVSFFLIHFLFFHPFRSNGCDKNLRYLAHVANENIDITSGSTSLDVEVDIDDHFEIHESWQNFEQGRIEIAEPVEAINLGTEKDPKNLNIGGSLPGNEKRELISLLGEYLDVFAWSYNDMPGLDPSIVVHRLPTKEEVKPKRQKLRRFRPDLPFKIKEEVKKLLDVGFIEVSDYSE